MEEDIGRYMENGGGLRARLPRAESTVEEDLARHSYLP
jgi:hypothetical protein